MSNLFGGANNDTLGGASNDDLVNGYGGDDTLSGGGGNDELNGGDDLDSLKGGGGDDLVNGDDGNDTLKGGGGIDTLNGGAEGDVMIGGAGADTLDGGEDGDEYRITAKDAGTADTYSDTGVDGEDVIDASRVIELMLGDFDSGSGIDTIRGDADDLLEIISNGSAVNWDFTGIALENVGLISGSGENDLITGSLIANKIKGGGGDDDINGAQGNDTLSGGGGADTIDGGTGEDNIKGGGGNDTLTGYDDDDRLAGGGGDDTLDGGEGSDAYVYKEGETASGDVLNDTGGDGIDYVDATGATTLDLGQVFNYSFGIEEIHGNEETGTALIATGDTGVEWDLSSIELVDISELVGAEGNDVIVTSGADDRISGGAGDDYLQGNEGDDILKGGGGDDGLSGNAGEDSLRGGGGDDNLDGGAGNDTLKGGGGDDTLKFDQGDVLVDGQDGTDTLFVQAEETQTVDLTELAGGMLKNIEVIDLGNGSITVVLDKVSVKDMSDTSETLTVNGGGDDAVTSVFAWTGGDVVEGYHVYTSGSVTLRVQDGMDVSQMNTTADDAPVLAVNTGAQLDANATITITAAMLGAADVDSDPDELVYKVTDLPDHGSILVDGVALLVNGTFTQADVDGGLVEYENDGIGTADGFEFTLSDGGNNDALSDEFSLVINADITGDGDNEFIYGGAGNDMLNGAGGNDVLSGYGGDDTLMGGDGLDQLFGGGGNDTLNGNDGNDSLTGGEGNDLLIGGDDNDEYTFINELGDEVVEAADEGTDIVKIFNFFELAGLTYTLTANVENAQLLGTFSFNLDGNALDNVLNASSADGDNILDGAGGNDTLFGGSGDDTLIGGNGNDFLSAGSGVDQLDGGTGNDDTAEFSEETGDLTVNLVNQSMTGGDAGDSIAGFENFIGGDGDDNITGTDGANEIGGGGGNDTLYGGGGNDTLYGGGGEDTVLGGNDDDLLHGDADNDFLAGENGNDTLSGGAGNDLLNGGAGNDVLYGGDGDDEYQLFDDGETVVENADEGTDLVILVVTGMVSGNYTLTENVENARLYDNDDFNVTGNALDNVIDAFSQSSGANTLDGAGGDDTLYGGAGNDNLNGGTGNDVLSGDDTLDGGAGEDSLDGFGGDDTLLGGSEIDNLNGGADDDALNGGEGNDVLFGDTGDDTFVFATTLGATNEDTIQDFEGAGAGGGDVIQLDFSIFSALATFGAAQFDSGAGLVEAADADTRIVYDTTTGNLYYDADGMGGNAAVHFATLSGSPDLLNEGDFVVVGVP